MLCINLHFVPGEVSKITFYFRIKIHCFKYLIKVYFKILSMTLAAFFPLFSTGCGEIICCKSFSGETR